MTSSTAMAFAPSPSPSPTVAFRARTPRERAVDLDALPCQQRARVVSRGVLAGVPTTTRSLIVELDGDTCYCTYSAGEQALAVWQFGIGALRAMATDAPQGRPRLGELDDMKREATRLFSGGRLAALRGSVQNVVVVQTQLSTLSRSVGAILLEALFEQMHETARPARTGAA